MPRSTLTIFVAFIFVFAVMPPRAMPGRLHAPSDLVLTISAKSANNRAYVLQQRHYFLGRWRIQIKNDRVRATNLNEEYSIVTMAPTWKVALYRDSTRCFYEVPLDTFLRTGLSISSGYTTEGLIKQAHKMAGGYHGLASDEYIFVRNLGLANKRPAWVRADIAKESPVFQSQYWVSPTLSNNKHVCAFLQKLLMLPSTDGVPVAFRDIRADGSTNMILDITSCKALSPDEIQIDYPKNYSRCKGEREITLSQTKREGLSEFAKSLGTP